MQGLEPEHFRLQLEKFCTRSVEESCDAIDVILSTYDASVAMELVPMAKAAEKAPYGAYKGKTTTSLSLSPSVAVSSSPTSYINCRNCDKPGHVWYRCNSDCLRCPPCTPAHKYWDDKMCKYKKTIPEGVATSKKPSKAHSMKAQLKDSDSRLATAMLEIEQLRAEKEVKKIYLDSAAIKSIIADLIHVDPHTLPSFVRNEELAGVEAANGALLAVEGTGQIMGVPGVLCSGASASLVSMVDVCDLHDASVLVTSSGARAFKNSEGSDVHVNNLNDYVTSTQTCILSAPP